MPLRQAQGRRPRPAEGGLWVDGGMADGLWRGFVGVLAPRQPEPPVGVRAAGARALADFGGLIQGAWIAGLEVFDLANG